MNEPGLRVRNLTKTFGQGDLAVAAVRNVDLDVAAGEVVLVMGPSGSGKTTLLLMLGALLKPSSGSIQVAGIDVATTKERQLPALRARHFGFIFQDFNLLGALNVIENVELACNLAGVTGAPARDRAQDLLERVGLTDRMRFRPEQLSGGEKQRVAIARALANDPPIILADEPTANLDSAHGRGIARLLRDLAKTDGRSILIVSHDARLREVADRVLWLEDGTFRELDALSVDPVCSMSVETPRTPHPMGRKGLVVLLRRMPQRVRSTSRVVRHRRRRPTVCPPPPITTGCSNDRSAPTTGSAMNGKRLVRPTAVLASVFLFLATSATAAAAHGGESSSAEELVLTAIAVLEVHPVPGAAVDDKILDAQKAADPAGVNMALVREAGTALEHGDVTAAKRLLEQSVGACPDNDILNVSDQSPKPPCVPPAHSLALARRSVGGSSEIVLLILAGVLALAGLAIVRRPHLRGRSAGSTR